MRDSFETRLHAMKWVCGYDRTLPKVLTRDGMINIQLGDNFYSKTQLEDKLLQVNSLEITKVTKSDLEFMNSLYKSLISMRDEDISTILTSKELQKVNVAIKTLMELV